MVASAAAAEREEERTGVMRICLKPPRTFPNLLRFRQELEGVAESNGCELEFGGMLGAVTVRGETGHVERFLAILGVTELRGGRKAGA